MKKGILPPPIVQDGDPVLRNIATPVKVADFNTSELNTILEQMKLALDKESDGVAIAAPQIGVPLRIFIVSRKAFAIEDHNEGEPSVITQKLPEKDMICINPEIIKLSQKKVKVPEGCLSVRWLYGNTRRSEKATIRAYDENGKPFTYGGSGLIAQIFQHETDHLNGTLFIDHATEIEELTEEEITAIKSKNAS
ncbi:MAG: peptide deformylase [Candidatus Lloydbacteria bacterium RIFOXYC12_FULL_46_25]|uniref:Peptide deformylase n=1 Tax=Candidatus Lloydbacteria bacterium RIFOXYC12_FULL_46_25 TaxID=1798670 RepID=A0A1G2E5H4_9BACT|nr:MAG: peptide deformylase [Candidatus Lloydbacteria bacterium RIFOXYC12_FULL_46_25]